MAHNAGDGLRLVRVPSAEVAPSVGAFACVSAKFRDALDAQIRALVDTSHPAEPCRTRADGCAEPPGRS